MMSTPIINPKDIIDEYTAITFPRCLSSAKALIQTSLNNQMPVAAIPIMNRKKNQR